MENSISNPLTKADLKLLPENHSTLQVHATFIHEIPCNQPRKLQSEL